jgi:hypothetical protein
VQFQANQLEVFLEGYPTPPVERMLGQLTDGWRWGRQHQQLPEAAAAIERILLYGYRQQLPAQENLADPQAHTWKLEVAVPDLSPGGNNHQSEAGRGDREGFYQARQGNLEAIAAFVQTGFAGLGVRLRVTARWKPLPHADGTINAASPQRLVLVCTAKTSPDPEVVADPISRHLRSLGGIAVEGSLATARDAIIQYHTLETRRTSGATGWTLWVDLRPAREILQTWAYWGDGEAIARLLLAAAPSSAWQVWGEVKGTTLHIFVSQMGAEGLAPPMRPATLQWIVPALQKIAPTGIQAATIYGARGTSNNAIHSATAPAWVHWTNLPRADVPPAQEQARGGNTTALAFLLERLLTPSLDSKLATGGVRVRCRWRSSLLHIMVDAPTSPERDRVAPAITAYVAGLEIPQLAGIRVYGRRSGMRSPAWKYRWDPTPTPDPSMFAREAAQAVTAAPTPAPAPAPAPTAAPETTPGWMARLLLGTGLLLPQSVSPSKLGILLATILSLLLAYQADRWLGVLVPTASESETNATQSPPTPNPSLENGDNANLDFSGIRLSDEKANQEDIFNRSQFTQKSSPTWSKRSVCHPDFWPDQPVSDDCQPVVPLDYPTFNATQVDRKLALYKRYLQQFGTPDVLVVGSSRALRGVDPAVLRAELAQQGYEDIRVFNMAVNGATAQVVDFMVRELLPVAYVPNLVVWADGARAFNSGRKDITYNAIAASRGYQQLANSDTRPIPSPDPKPVAQEPESTAPELSLDTSVQEVNRWLQEQLAATSQTYDRREQLLAYLQAGFRQGYTALVPQPWQSLLPTPTPPPEDPTRTVDTNQFDFTGFLPIEVRFNPETYYEKHPKVSGKYDRDYQDFSLDGEQQQATRRLLDYTEAHDIKLVFVNLPLTEQYLDPVRSAYEKQFQQHMLRLAMERDFHFRDLSQLWPNKYKYFSDPSHLNRYGAYRVSQELAADPMVPWVSEEE